MWEMTLFLYLLAYKEVHFSFYVFLFLKCDTLQSISYATNKLSWQFITTVHFGKLVTNVYIFSILVICFYIICLHPTDVRFRVEFCVGLQTYFSYEIATSENSYIFSLNQGVCNCRAVALMNGKEVKVLKRVLKMCSCTKARHTTTVHLVHLYIENQLKSSTGSGPQHKVCVNLL